MLTKLILSEGSNQRFIDHNSLVKGFLSDSRHALTRMHIHVSKDSEALAKFNPGFDEMFTFINESLLKAKDNEYDHVGVKRLSEGFKLKYSGILKNQDALPEEIKKVFKRHSSSLDQFIERFDGSLTGN